MGEKCGRFQGSEHPFYGGMEAAENFLEEKQENQLRSLQGGVLKGVARNKAISGRN